MKIGFFTDVYNLKWYFGVEAAIETFREGLEALGHEVFIYAPRVPGLKDKDLRIFRFSSFKAIKKPEMYLALPFFSEGKILERISKIFTPKLDIVHIHTPLTLGLLGKYVARYQKIPLVCTYHTQFSEYVKFYLKEKILLPKIAKVVMKWYTNGSDLVIAPSLKIKKLLESYGVRKPILILPTGISLEIFKKPSEKVRQILRQKFNISPEKKVLLFVGRISKEKNPDFLFSAFQEVLKQRKDIVLLMVGDGSDLERLKNLAKELKIDKFIKFTGQVPHQEIPFYYQAADLFVFPSFTETQGVVILEAMATGLPVIVLKDDAFKWIVFNNKNGFLVEKPLAKIFAQKTLEILDSPSIYKKFSQFALKTATNFSTENQTRKLLKIYQDLLEKKPKC